MFEKAAACFESAYQFHKIAEYKEKAYYARKLAAYGQKETEELAEDKISEEFIKQSETVLKELEEKSKLDCEQISQSDFLKKREKMY